MVPGDYNLRLLDELLWNKEVEQIGCCNEMPAHLSRRDRPVLPAIYEDWV